MRYRPVKVEENVNVPRRNLLVEFAYLIGTVLLLVVGFYYASGFTVDFIVDRYPERADSAIGRMYSGMFRVAERSRTELYLQEIVDDLSGEDGRFYVRVLNSPAVNAAAIPGGTILVFSGLVDAAGSDNEMAFVLGHEVGHFRNRDHLRKFGRSMLVILLASTVMGDGSSASNFILSSVQNAGMRYSQGQELSADRQGLELMNAAYGHVGGATDFFARQVRFTTDSKLAYLFTTHPHPRKRAETLNGLIDSLGYQRSRISPKFTIYNAQTYEGSN